MFSIKSLGASAVAASFLLLAGCASQARLPTELSLPQAKVTVGSSTELIRKPELNTVFTAELGETLVSKSFLKITPLFKLNQEIKTIVQAGEQSLTWSVWRGELEKFASSNHGDLYKSNGFSVAINDNSRYYEFDTGGVVITKAGDTTTAQLFWSPRSSSITYVAPLTESVALEVMSPRVEVSQENLKRELIYTGVVNNVISVLYREYVNEMARPAYTQDLKYDLATGKTIGFKGARIEVVSATNTGISYKVLNHLD